MFERIKTSILYAKLFNQAQELRSNGNHKEACLVFEKILSLPIKAQWRAILVYASSLVNAGRPTESIEFFVSGLALLPKSSLNENDSNYLRQYTKRRLNAFAENPEFENLLTSCDIKKEVDVAKVDNWIKRNFPLR